MDIAKDIFDGKSLSYEQFEQAIKISCRLFRGIAVLIAESLGCIYPEEYEQGFMKYTKAVTDA